MPTQSVDSFLSLLERSELLSPSQCALWQSRRDEWSDGGELASAMLAARALTPWQQRMLLEGRWKGYYLGKYRILSQLGAGAMGHVFLAEHKVMRHRVAVKVLAKRLAQRQAYVQRFEQEARAAAAVNHPRIVRAYDVDSAGDLHFLVMEYIDGEDLQKIVDRDGPLPAADVARCLRQAAEGLAAAHAAGIVHRDIKPANLLLDRQRQLHILDLGLARISDDETPSLTIAYDSKMIGTVDYLAPEQARSSHDVDPRADLYALGAAGYYLLTGVPPFPEGTLTERILAHQTQPPLPLRDRRPDVPAGLAAICHKLLEKKPGDRYQNAQELIAAIDAWQSGGGTAIVRTQPAPKSAKPAPQEDLVLADLDDDTPRSELDTIALRTSDTHSGSNSGLRRAAAAPSAPKLRSSGSSLIAAAPAAKCKPIAAKSMQAKLPQAKLLLPAEADEYRLKEISAADPLAAMLDECAAAPALSAISQPAKVIVSTEPRLTLAQRVRSVVASEEEGVRNYALWFLLFAGIFIGGTLLGVGYVAKQSFDGPKASVKKSFER